MSNNVLELPVDKPQQSVIISVDVETTSTSPFNGDLLSIGAATVHLDDLDRMEIFYVNLTPAFGRWDPDTRDWWQQFPERLAETQVNRIQYATAMQQFADWVKQFHDPVFMAYPAHFDFAWVDQWFKMSGIENPFSYKPLDQVSFYCGKLGKPAMVKGSRSKGTLQTPVEWEGKSARPHNALDDAVGQREGFIKMLKDTKLV